MLLLLNILLLLLLLYYYKFYFLFLFQSLEIFLQVLTVCLSQIVDKGKTSSGQQMNYLCIDFMIF